MILAFVSLRGCRSAGIAREAALLISRQGNLNPIGTSFVILPVGFSAGLMLAKSALHDQPAQSRTTSEPSPAMRVVLPASAEPALQAAAVAPVPEP
jgi:hypothetical protein